MRKKTIVKNALVLTVAGLITRVMGFVYRIYMSNAVGAEGIGLYQMIMPIYSLAWSIACSGFNTTISKLVAEEKARGEHSRAGRILKVSLLISCGISVLLTLLLFMFADEIAVIFFKDTRIILALKILSISFPFMAAGSCLRGYFFGMQETMVPAINQVLEQCVRMSVIMLLAGSFIPLGLGYACAVCVIGVVAEEIFSFIYVLISYKRAQAKRGGRKRPAPPGFDTAVLPAIMAMALPLTLNRVISSLLSSLENVLIPQRLALYGGSRAEALAAFGRISGMAMPLIYFPSVFLMSLSTTLVPAIAEASAAKETSKINSTVSKTVLFASVIGVGAASLFTVFANELGQIIYKQDLSHILFCLGLMCPFLYIQMAVGGVLNGLGFQVFIFRNSLMSSVINILFIYFLVPRMGMDGFIIGWFVSLVIISILDLEKLKRSVKLDIEFANWFFKPLVSGLAAALTVRLAAKAVLFKALGNGLGLAAAVLVLAVLYLFFIIVTGCISVKDFKALLLPRSKPRHA